MARLTGTKMLMREGVEGRILSKNDEAKVTDLHARVWSPDDYNNSTSCTTPMQGTALTLITGGYQTSTRSQTR